MNLVVVSGNLVADPEKQSGKTGTVYAQFTVAESRKTPAGEKTNFFSCTCFGKTAEFLSEYGRKGGRVWVEGELSQDTWQDQEGKKHSQVKILAMRVEVERRGEKPATQARKKPEPDMFDDLIPF